LVLPNGGTFPYGISGNNIVGLYADSSGVAHGFIAMFSVGDFNFDGHVDAADIQTMIAALTDLNTYQTNNDLTPAELRTIADVNRDGVVNNADLQALLDLLKTGGGSADSVPEPASWILAFLAFAMVSGTRFYVRRVR
jgi:Dockerin type I domain